MRPRRPPPKKEIPMINELIRAASLRVLGDDGPARILTREEALGAAEDAGLDLVLVDPNADPPVAKIVSYDKYRYEQEKKKKESLKKSREGSSKLKEVKVSYKIGEHDYDVMRRRALKFLSSGDKVKVSMQFRGREVVTGKDQGRELLLKMAEELEEVGILDAQPKVMGRQMIMMVSPKPKK
jgi:translation initiation factor IF-3